MMGVSETVAALAEAVAQFKAPTEARHRILVQILRLMPLYRDIRDLSAWESAFQRALEEKDDESEIGKLLWEVFEFGRFNLYCAFNAAGTEVEFDSLAQELKRSGVRVSPPGRLTEW